MKHCAWFWLMSGLGFGLLPGGPAAAQSPAGTWQGVEFNAGAASSAYWPQVLTLRAGRDGALVGELRQVAGSTPTVTATFAVRGTRTATGLRLSHVRVLAETDPNGAGWCLGTLVLRYDAAKERLLGYSVYTAEGCHGGATEFNRVVLKSAAVVPRGVPSVLRVSGRNVRWFADAALRRPLAAGNTYRARLSKTTTFYLTQSFYSTTRSPVTPITLRVKAVPPPAPPAPLTLPAVAPPALPPAEPALVPPPGQTVAASAPVVSRALPTVLFRVATAELLPAAAPALDSLAAVLRRFPTRRFRIEGHTDRLGETDKNLALSQQRAEAVKSYLVQAGIAPARLETVGYGDTRPVRVAPNPENRRVEVRALPPGH